MRVHKAYPYVVQVAPTVLPLSPAEVKAHLKLPADTDTDLDNYLTDLIKVAVDAGEKFCKRDFINRTYCTYRDNFPNTFILRRSPASSVSSIKYYSNGVLTTVDPTTYFLTVETARFNRITLLDGQAWPGPVDSRQQAVQVVFVAGYGAAAANVPQAIKLAMLHHIAQLWTHRGDNDFPNGQAEAEKLPEASRLLYNGFLIPEV